MMVHLTLTLAPTPTRGMMVHLTLTLAPTPTPTLSPTLNSTPTLARCRANFPVRLGLATTRTLTLTLTQTLTLTLTRRANVPRAAARLRRGARQVHGGGVARDESKPHPTPTPNSP